MKITPQQTKQICGVDLMEILGEKAVKTRVVLNSKEFKVIQKTLKDRGGATYLQKHFGVNKWTSYQYLSGRRNLPVKIYLSLVDEFERISLKMVTNKAKTVHFPMQINKDLAYLAGALRDGWLIQVDGNVIGLGMEQSEQPWLRETLVPIYLNQFGVRPVIKQTTLTLYSELVGEYIHKVLEMPVKSQASWETPKCVLKASEEIQKHFIAGFWDAEGTCLVREEDPQIRFSQNNPKGSSISKKCLKTWESTLGK
ncbi:MAG: hypothetical protein J7K68_05155 [Candidatus Diapherotrites archaeon]|nr:hypothetical protein [Candidatus Diapherotrites archaeon]